MFGLAIAIGSIALGLSILYYLPTSYENLPPDLISPDEATEIAREELVGIGYLPGFHSIELIYVNDNGMVFIVDTDGSLEEHATFYAEVLPWDNYYWIVSFYPPFGEIPERGLIINAHNKVIEASWVA